MNDERGPYVVRRCLAGVMMLVGAIGADTSAVAQGVTVDETVLSVRRMLERLPYYGLFHYIVFRVDSGTIYLAGYSFEGRLKADAETAALSTTPSNIVRPFFTMMWIG